MRASATTASFLAGTTSQSKLNFHMGEAFCRVASDYPTVLDIILEQVQNAIDANAKNILVLLNRKTRHIAIRDDGDGVTQQMFEDALQRVCLSSKESGKLGRFGIGLISPLGKCEKFTFTSSRRGYADGYREWTFVTDTIRRQAQDVVIPHKQRPDLFFIKKQGQPVPRGLTSVMWRTEVNILTYTHDRMIGRIGTISQLKDAILERFGAAMRRHDVTLSLKFADEKGETESLLGIKANLFTGRPLPVIVLDDPATGKVTFTLFLAPLTIKGPQGKVIVGETDNDYRFGFDIFARSTEGLLPEDVVAGLKSGVFEGEIVAENVTLHSTRRSFEKDEALVGFCTAIESWFKEHGQKHLEEVNKASREQRYQDLGLESLREIEELLKDPAFADLRTALDEFKFGSVGSGNAAGAKAKGKQDEPAVSTDYTGRKKGDGSTKGDGTRNPPQPDPEPYTVAGPSGQRRGLVKNGNLGLQFSYIAMDGSDKLWELDIRQGVLHFNVNHPIWALCDTSDRKVRQLQETVAINALLIQAMPDDLQDGVRLAFDEALRPLVHLFHVSPAFNLRKRAQAQPKE